jgi:hypothetical protein
MPKISELPYINPEGLYYHDFTLVANGPDENGDYVTGQILAESAIRSYVSEKITSVSGSYLSEACRVLFMDDYYPAEIYTMPASEFTSAITSYIVEGNYLSDYTNELIGSYISNGWADEYLQGFASTYTDNYMYDMSFISATERISGGLVVKNYGSLNYIPMLDVDSFICSTIYYDRPYPYSLNDSTPIAGMYAYEKKLGSITLGAIVSYIKEHL